MKEGRSTSPALPSFEEAVDQAVQMNLRWLTWGVFLLFLVFVLFALKSVGQRAVLLEMILDLAVMVLLGALGLALRRDLVPARWSNGLVLVVGLLVQANVLGSIFVADHPRSLDFVPYLIIGAGSFLLSARYLAVGLAVIIGTALPAAARHYASGQLLDFAVTMGAGMVLSVALHAARMRHQRLTHGLRQRDRDISLRLTEALRQLELQFAEHKRGEAQRRELEQQLQQSQKMEAVGILAGGIAHDINNLLTVIMSTASLMRDGRAADDPLLVELDAILETTRRGASLTRNLLGFARKGEFRPERVDVSQAVRQVVEILERTGPKHIAIETRLAEDLPDIEIDPGQMTQVVMNLCLNAVDAMDGGGRLVIATDVVGAAAAEQGAERPAEMIRLRVSDDGKGMTAEAMRHAFEPFFTTKAAGKGTGLGLSMVYGSVTAHGGQVTLDSEPGQGTTVTILLPSSARTGADDGPRLAAPPVPRSGVILVVDDEPLIRSACRRILTRLGFEVLLANDGQQALALYREQRDRIVLVLLDMVMPVMDGAECLRRLREIDPWVAVVVMSGYARAHGVADAAAQADGFVAKPFDHAMLTGAIDRALAEVSASHPGRYPG